MTAPPPQTGDEKDLACSLSVIFVYLFSLRILHPIRKGTKSGASGRCFGCQGTGTRTTSRRFEPGMIQRNQHVCSECRGSGT